MASSGERFELSWEPAGLTIDVDPVASLIMAVRYDSAVAVCWRVYCSMMVLGFLVRLRICIRFGLFIMGFGWRVRSGLIKCGLSCIVVPLMLLLFPFVMMLLWWLWLVLF